MRYRNLRITHLPRLMLLIFIGAFLGWHVFGESLFATNSGGVWTLDRQLEGAILGSLIGAQWELFLRLADWSAGPVRFSLRTLLIATTLVAVVLGVMVAVLRWQAG